MALTQIGKEGVTGISNSSDATAITIDSSENVLVGKTSSGIATAGIELRANNDVLITKDGDSCLYLNRLTNDGPLVEFIAAGTSRGNIGIASSENFYISGQDNNQVGLLFNGDGERIQPCNASGTGRDNLIDLGEGSGRFKDLYLGGGAFIGGTAAANKLDDYEEGTFTPIWQQGLTSAGYATQQGAYTKIGRQVICSLFLRANSGTENGDAIYLGGLPFTVRNASSVDHSEGAFWTYNGGFWNSDANTSWLARVNETNLAFFKQSDGGAIQGSTSGVATNLNADVRLVVVYTTN